MSSRSNSRMTANKIVSSFLFSRAYRYHMWRVRQSGSSLRMRSGWKSTVFSIFPAITTRLTFARRNVRMALPIFASGSET